MLSCLAFNLKRKAHYHCLIFSQDPLKREGKLAACIDRLKGIKVKRVCRNDAILSPPCKLGWRQQLAIPSKTHFYSSSSPIQPLSFLDLLSNTHTGATSRW